MNELAAPMVTGLQSHLVGGGLVLMLVGAALALTRELPGKLARYLIRQVSVSCEVFSPDPVYEWLASWLDRHPYSRRARLLSVESAVGEDRARVLFTPAPGYHWVWYHRRLMIVQRARRPLDVAIGRNARTTEERIIVRVLGRSQALLRRLIEDAREVYLDRSRSVAVYTTRYGEWAPTRRFTPRPLETVILPGTLRQDIERDVGAFLDSRSWYEERGVPWRRGYLLHGLPGTGKTTLISAIAGSIGYDLYFINLLSAAMDDEALTKLLLSTPQRTAIVFEDIDTVLEGRSIMPSGHPPGATGAVSFSGLLNALDGVTARPGLLVWMTTNHLEKLDPALIRPGRIDRLIEFGPATHDQIRQMFQAFFPGAHAAPDLDHLARRWAARGVSMAEVQRHLLLHKDDPLAALESVTEACAP